LAIALHNVLWRENWCPWRCHALFGHTYDFG
jgi:hypothetical protein